MARYEEDIFTVTFDLQATISLDIERILGDPRWGLICLQNGAEPDQFHPDLFREYLNYYLVRDRLLTEIPSSNGPAELILMRIL